MKVTATQYMKDMGIGKSKPQLLRCEDGFDYVVKFGFTSRKKRMLVNEWITYRLAKMLDLPVPECRVIYVSKELLHRSLLSSDFEFQPGLHFGSRYISNMEYPSGDVLAKCGNLDKAADMIVFDHWINNIERYNQRKNLIIDPNNNYSLMLIDHGHSLYRPGWSMDMLRQNIYKVEILWGNLYERFVPYLDSEDPFRAAIQSIQSVKRENLKEVVSEIPEEWKISKAELNMIVEYLDKRRQRIESAIDQLRPNFPLWNRSESK